MFWNCQGIRSKRNELELYPKENSIDIIVLNETFLHKKITFKIQCYDTIRNDRSTGSRGGIAFLVKHGLVVNKKFRNADFNTITENEALPISLELSTNLHFIRPSTTFLTMHVCRRFQLEIRSLWMRQQKHFWSYAQNYPKQT